MFEASYLTNTDFPAFGTYPSSNPDAILLAFILLFGVNALALTFTVIAYSISGGLTDVNIKSMTILAVSICALSCIPIVFLSSSWPAFIGLSFGQCFVTNVATILLIARDQRKSREKQKV